MAKDEILDLLIGCGGRASAGEIKERLSLSEQELSSALSALKAKGCELYCGEGECILCSCLDEQARRRLSRLLPGRQANKLIVLSFVGSTSDYLRALARDGAEEGTVVVAARQSAGKGRLGRRFVSADCRGTYLSVLMRPDCPLTAASQLTAWAAVAAARAVENLCGLRPDIKWVNDLLLGGKKICGILTETAFVTGRDRPEFLVIGIGINVKGGAADFPPDLREKVSTLEEHFGRKFETEEMTAALIEQLDKLSADFPVRKRTYLEEYRRGCLTAGRDVKIISGPRESFARALEVDEDFGLRVRYPDGREESVAAGEVSVRNPDGSYISV